MNLGLYLDLGYGIMRNSKATTTGGIFRTSLGEPFITSDSLTFTVRS